MNEKDKFIFSEILDSTIRASFSHNKLYKDGLKKIYKDEVRKIIGQLLCDYWNEYKTEVDSKKHLQNILNLQKNIFEKCSGYFFDEINLGTVQKLFNLFLKYLWVHGKIRTPPHCPFDSIVIQELQKINRERNLEKKLVERWTMPKTKTPEEIKRTLITVDDYMALVVVADDESKMLSISIAEWELEFFNKRNEKLNKK